MARASFTIADARNFRIIRNLWMIVPTVTIVVVIIRRCGDGLRISRGGITIKEG